MNIISTSALVRERDYNDYKNNIHNAILSDSCFTHFSSIAVQYINECINTDALYHTV